MKRGASVTPLSAEGNLLVVPLSDSSSSCVQYTGTAADAELPIESAFGSGEAPCKQPSHNNAAHNVIE